MHERSAGKQRRAHHRDSCWKQDLVFHPPPGLETPVASALLSMKSWLAVANFMELWECGLAGGRGLLLSLSRAVELGSQPLPRWKTPPPWPRGLLIQPPRLSPAPALPLVWAVEVNRQLAQLIRLNPGHPRRSWDQAKLKRIRGPAP